MIPRSFATSAQAYSPAPRWIACAARSSGAAAISPTSTIRRHEFRKDAKKLRYAAEFFAAQFDRKRQRRQYKRFIAALEALQEALGTLNDLMTAPAALNQLGIANSPDTMAMLFPDSRKKLLETAGEAHAALVDAGRFWR